LIVHLTFEILGYIAAVAVYLLLRRSGDAIGDRERATVLSGAALGAAIGTRLLFWLSYPGVQMFDGKTIVGGLLGGLIGVELTKRAIGVDRSTGDLLVYPIITALSIGRIGCFLAGPIDRTEGLPSNLPWAIAVGDGVRRHPVALYEIAFLIALIPLIRRVHGEGAKFRTFMVAYLAFRLFVDFLKPEPPPLAGGLTAIQYACVAGLAYYGANLIRRSRRVQEAV
jgi:phosphatidylglycerol:prolipoprotein diacylglycerol transferase